MNYEKLFSIEEVGETAKEVLSLITSEYKKQNDKVFIVGLVGDLGSGKTTLSKEIGKELGVEESISSPTFVIRRDYDLKDETFKKLIHIDAYRLENKEESSKILNIQNEEVNTLVIVEWPENSSFKLNLKLSITHEGDKRKIAQNGTI